MTVANSTVPFSPPSCSLPKGSGGRGDGNEGVFFWGGSLGGVGRVFIYLHTSYSSTLEDMSSFFHTVYLLGLTYFSTYCLVCNIFTLFFLKQSVLFSLQLTILQANDGSYLTVLSEVTLKRQS
jgi:hypothetical protein